MRVGSFVLMRGKNRRHFEAILCVPKVSRFEYERKDRLGYIEQAIQFLNQTRSSNDPDAVDILVTLWSDLKKQIEEYIQAECIQELLRSHRTENPDEPPTPIPF